MAIEWSLAHRKRFHADIPQIWWNTHVLCVYLFRKDCKPILRNCIFRAVFELFSPIAWTKSFKKCPLKDVTCDGMKLPIQYHLYNPKIPQKCWNWLLNWAFCTNWWICGRFPFFGFNRLFFLPFLQLKNCKKWNALQKVSFEVWDPTQGVLWFPWLAQPQFLVISC